MLVRIVAFFWLIGATSSALAQEAFSDGLPRKESSATEQSTAENAWIDLRQYPSAASRPQSAPSWVEAVNMTSTTGADGTPRSVFRVRVGRPAGDYQVMFFRLFFDDNANARPEIVAWDESGSQVLRSGELGSGVGLPTSDSVMIPMSGISTLDIEVPGDGKTIRGAYLDWMTSSEVVHPLNAEHRDIIPEPFSSLPPLHSPEQDLEKFGTVTATLASETIPVGSDAQRGAVVRRRADRDLEFARHEGEFGMQGDVLADHFGQHARICPITRAISSTDPALASMSALRNLATSR